jgi:hypothetical protein
LPWLAPKLQIVEARPAKLRFIVVVIPPTPTPSVVIVRRCIGVFKQLRHFHGIRVLEREHGAGAGVDRWTLD